MIQNNYLNLHPDKLNQYIYRIIPQAYLFEMFKESKNTLVSPQFWKDPFENFILNSKAKLPSGETGSFGFRDDFFGQCWSTNPGSDAMWRLYSEKSDGIRIRTTIKKLLESLYSHCGEIAPLSAFIGRVKYMKDQELREFSQNIFLPALNAESLAKSYLVKRRAFKHESEIRLIYQECKNIKYDDRLFRYKINPHHLVDDIMLDPRTPIEEIKNLKSEIKAKTHFKGTIRKSLLYAPPKGFLIPIGA